MRKSKSDTIFEMYFKDGKSERKIAEELKIKQGQVSSAIGNKLKQIGEPNNLYSIKQGDHARILQKYYQKKQEKLKI